MKIDSKRILALGPNPAWQKTLFFNELRLGEVNRAGSMKCFASGKGINFCRAGRSWGNEQVELLQFAGGYTGADLCSYLDAEGIVNHTVKIADTTRICCTCLPDGQPMTELIEPSPRISEEELKQYHTLLHDKLKSFDGVAFCGTLPDGCSSEIYRRAAEITGEAGLPLLVDSWQDIAPVLETGAKIIFKVNAEEIKVVADEDNIVEAIRKIMTRYSLLAVAVTDGPGKAYLAYGHKLFIYELPVLDKIISSLGCGDTNAAIFFSEYLAGTEPEQAFARGLAAASASCLTATCGEFAKDTAEKLCAKIKISANIL